VSEQRVRKRAGEEAEVNRNKSEINRKSTTFLTLTGRGSHTPALPGGYGGSGNIIDRYSRLTTLISSTIYEGDIQ
jgi:hypothetical protein